MRIIADLHIHSKYSRAVSRDMTPENLDIWARKKGITVMGTGDFTHPKWLEELKEKLEPAENGLYQLGNSRSQDGQSSASAISTRFLLTVEIAVIYSKGGKVRRIHHLVFAPSFAVAEKINKKLAKIGNLTADGRPILGLDSKELLKIVKDADPAAVLVPAHCLLPDEYIHTKNGVEEIQNIKKGEYVFTHKGRLKQVEEVYTRPYKGEVYHIKPWYFRLGLTTTPEHPFLAMKTQKHCEWQHGFCRPDCKGKSHCCKKHKARNENFKPRWIQAKDLEKSDILIFPRLTKVIDVGSFLLSSYYDAPKTTFMVSHSSHNLSEKKQTITLRGARARALDNTIPVNKEFCRLAGYFVAEGSVNGRDAISFTFATKEKEYLDDVKGLMISLFGIPCAKERLKGKSIELIFFSKILQSVFSSLFYNDSNTHRAHTKAFPQWMLFLPPKKQAEIFKGWWRGDTGYTVSRELMDQIKIIALRLDIIPSITRFSKEDFNKGTHKIGRRVITSSHDLFRFSGLAFFDDTFGLQKEQEFQKNKFIPKLDRRHGWMDETNIYIPIRDIDIKRHEGVVYNLEVKEDHSYLAEFAAVHNCWTPWFSVFGSMSGFDSLEECFEELTPEIFAVETGLSSDPPMNWRVPVLEHIALISNSDSHSLRKIGREANVFGCQLSYQSIMEAIKSRDQKKFLYTIEFFPEEGKYHYDGHRDLHHRQSSEETKKAGGRCATCGAKVTVGVLSRVEELALFHNSPNPSYLKRGNSDVPPLKVRGGEEGLLRIPYKSLIPLQEIIADVYSVGVASKRVQAAYEAMIERFDSEFAILLDTPHEELARYSPEIAEGIACVREGRVIITPGYDGEYGKVAISTKEKQQKLF